MSKYLITLEVTTEDNPEKWDFDYFVNLSDDEDFIVTSIKEIEGASEALQQRADRTNPYLLTTEREGK